MLIRYTSIRAVQIILMMLVFSGCTTNKLYSGKSLPDSDTVTVILGYNNTVIEKIDGEPVRPHPFRWLTPAVLGGGYYTLGRTISIREAKILPGPHTLITRYKSLYKISQEQFMEFAATAGHTYRINSILDNCISISPKAERCRWEPFLEDLNTGETVVRISSGILESVKPSKPLSSEIEQTKEPTAPE